MVQIFEKVENEAIYVLLPEVEAKAEKVEEKPEQIKKRFKFSKHAMHHQERINVKMPRAKYDSRLYQVQLHNR